MTRGFSPVGEPAVAVCLLPGTEVAFESEVQRKVTGFQLRFFKREPEYIRQKVARFRQVNVENPHTHHDAIEFPDGQIVLLTHLRVGQRAAVLQLPALAKSPARKDFNLNAGEPLSIQTLPTFHHQTRSVRSR